MNKKARLFIYDHQALRPHRIPFTYVREDIIGWTRFRDPIWGYIFTDAKHKPVWSCQYGHCDGEIALRKAKEAGRFTSLEDEINFDLITFDQVMKELGIEFKDREEHYLAYEETRAELAKEGIHMKPMPKPVSMVLREKRERDESGNKAPASIPADPQA
ncbi:MAG: hypothetical protein IJS52_03045 [Bacilli bacterium]|nr:hypothetical protein [Bacilli bacterium]